MTTGVRLCRNDSCLPFFVIIFHYVYYIYFDRLYTHLNIFINPCLTIQHGQNLKEKDTMCVKKGWLVFIVVH